MAIKLTERWEYDMSVQEGFTPLLDDRFQLDINLRIEIQRELFQHSLVGRADNVERANQRFFKWIWKHKKHYCEETMQPLRSYSAVYCSHILTRGAYPDMAFDPRNINLLCFDMHNKWENGNRKSMRIYERNMKIIEQLKKEYEISKF